MQNMIKKYIQLLIFLPLFVGIMMLAFHFEEEEQIHFYFEKESATVRFSAFETDESLYVFLPSYAEMDQIRVYVPYNTTVVLDDMVLLNGMSCNGFQLNKEYTLTNGKGEETFLQFLRAENVPAMHINTASGSMERIHENKENTERAEVCLITETGEQDYYSEQCEIKGRGNATWDYSKKPYLITLPAEDDLLGMGKASKWVLLANSTDMSNLHNKIVLEFAAKQGIGWVPECRYVDLYLNGEYWGLYLLCEKVEVQEGRLALDTVKGEFLCRVDLDNRWDSLRNPFISQAGRTVEISEPKSFSQEEEAAIQNHVNQLEEIILSGRDLSEENAFDMISWAGRYLIDEIFGNIDADLASGYFYYKNGKFFAGPLWDYDRALGNSHRNVNASAFVAKNLYKSPQYISRYYDALYRNESFYAKVAELYQTQYLPGLQQILDTEIAELEHNIAASVRMNNLRWESMFRYLCESGSIFRTSAQSIREYLQERTAFLSSVWIAGEEYCTIQYKPEEETVFTALSVKPGTILKPEMFGVSEKRWEYLGKSTGIDLSHPVTTDLLLVNPAYFVVEPEEAMDETETVFETTDAVAAISLTVLMVLLLMMVIISSKWNSAEKRSEEKAFL